MAEENSIDTTNRHMVSVMDRSVVVMNPPTRLTRLSADEAMAFAAWLAAIASIHSSRPFQDFYDAVCNT